MQYRVLLSLSTRRICLDDPTWRGIQNKNEWIYNYYVWINIIWCFSFDIGILKTGDCMNLALCLRQLQESVDATSSKYTYTTDLAPTVFCICVSKTCFFFNKITTSGLLALYLKLKVYMAWYRLCLFLSLAASFRYWLRSILWTVAIFVHRDPPWSIILVMVSRSEHVPTSIWLSVTSLTAPRDYS